MNAYRLAYWVGFAMVCAMAVFLRTGAVHDSVVVNPLRADALDYFSYAYNLREFGTYSREPTFTDHRAPLRPDALRSPGYPALVALFIGHESLMQDIDSVLQVQAVLSCLTVLIWAYLGLRVLGPAGSLLCAAFVAISPHLVNSNIYVLSESLFTFELSIVFLLGDHLLRAQGRRLWILAIALGIVLGVTNLTRASLIGWWALFLPVCLLPALRRWLAPLAVAAAIFLAINGAWMLRNHEAIGQWSDKTLAANFLQHGMYPGFEYHDRPESFGIPYRYDPRNAYYSAHPRRVMTEILHRFAQEPGRFLRWYLIGKPTFLYSWDIVGGMGDSFVYPIRATPYADRTLFRITHAVAHGLHWPLVGLALLGMGLLCFPGIRGLLGTEQRRFLSACALFLAYFTGLHIIGAPFPRYGVPVQPVLYLLGLVPVYLVWKMRAATALGSAGEAEHADADDPAYGFQLDRRQS